MGKQVEKRVATKFGLINETYFSLRSPRAIEDDLPFDAIADAFEAAAEMLQRDECEEIAIVRCRYSRRLECWVEVVGGGVITIDARDADDDMLGDDCYPGEEIDTSK